MSIQALRDKHAAVVTLAKNMIAEKGDQVWSAEERKQFDTWGEEIERLRDQIQAIEKMNHRAALERFEDAERKPIKEQGKDNLFAKFLRSGEKGMTRDEVSELQNALSTGTGSQGGYTVPTEMASSLIDLLKGYRGIREVATPLKTSSGANYPWPTSDGRNEEGEIVDENASASDQDPSFGTVGFPTYKWSSKVVNVPFELLQDSIIDVESFVNGRLKDRLGRIQNRKMTVGTGIKEPLGLVTAATVGKVGATGQAATVTWVDLVDLIESIDYAYASDGDFKFMISQTMRRQLRQLKDNNGRPLWTPSYDAGLTAKSPDLLMGYEIALNNDMPAPAPNAKSIAFGRLSAYIVRDVQEVTLFRFDDSIYIKRGQIGFMGWARCGGTLPDANTIAVYQHPAS